LVNSPGRGRMDAVGEDKIALLRVVCKSVEVS
jgi:hypothetical protein